MTLKEKRLIYERFRSKTECACTLVYNELNKNTSNIVEVNKIINEEIIPDIWDHVNSIISKHNKL